MLGDTKDNEQGWQLWSKILVQRNLLCQCLTNQWKFWNTLEKKTYMWQAVYLTYDILQLEQTSFPFGCCLWLKKQTDTLLGDHPASLLAFLPCAHTAFGQGWSSEQTCEGLWGVYFIAFFTWKDKETFQNLWRVTYSRIADKEKHWTWKLENTSMASSNRWARTKQWLISRALVSTSQPPFFVCQETVAAADIRKARVMSCGLKGSPWNLWTTNLSDSDGFMLGLKGPKSQALQSENEKVARTCGRYFGPEKWCEPGNYLVFNSGLICRVVSRPFWMCTCMNLKSLNLIMLHLVCTPSCVNSAAGADVCRRSSLPTSPDVRIRAKKRDVHRLVSEGLWED